MLIDNLFAVVRKQSFLNSLHFRTSFGTASFAVLTNWSTEVILLFSVTVKEFSHLSVNVVQISFGHFPILLELEGL